MKNRKGFSIVIYLLLIFLTINFIWLTGCTEKEKDNNSSVAEETYNPPVLTSNGVDIENYTIIISSNSSKAEKYAAEELQKYIKLGSKKDIQIQTDDKEPQDYEIILGKTSRQETKSVNFESLKDEGFLLKSEGDKLIIASNNQRGALYGVYSYLELLGYRFYTSTVESYPSENDIFIAKDLNQTQIPKFEYREVMYYDAWSDDFAVKQKINSSFIRSGLQNEEKYGGNIGYGGGDRMLVHTLSTLLPESYYSTKPEYFALVDGKRVKDQPCFTSENALEVVYNSVLEILKKKPDLKLISISQNDNDGYCTDEKCMESYEKYGKSGTVINFVNKIADRLKADYPDLIIDTLSYGWTSELPKGGVKPLDNVSIRLCTSMSQTFTNVEDSSVLKEEVKRLNDWSKICDRIYVWYYVANYYNYYSIYPNFYSMHQNFKFFLENNTVGIYSEGFGSPSGEFGELRSYILAKLSWNPEMSKAEYLYHIKDFAKGFYGEGGENIYDYIIYLEELVLKNVANGGSEVTTGDNLRFLPIDMDYSTNTFDLTWINKCKELWAQAEELATPEQLERLEKSKIALKYFELYNTMSERYKEGNSDERDELKRENEELYNAMLKWKVTKKTNETEISKNVTTFELSPKYW